MFFLALLLFTVVATIATIGAGGIGGIFAGLFWSYRMLLCTRNGIQGGKLVNRGIFWGIVVGIADTLLLHLVGLVLVILEPGLDFGEWLSFLKVGLFCGVSAGAIIGVFAGIVWNAKAKKYPLTTAEQE